MNVLASFERDVSVCLGQLGSELSAFARPFGCSISFLCLVRRGEIDVHNAKVSILSIGLALQFARDWISDTPISVESRNIILYGRTGVLQYSKSTEISCDFLVSDYSHTVCVSQALASRENNRSTNLFGS